MNVTVRAPVSDEFARAKDRIVEAKTHALRVAKHAWKAVCDAGEGERGGHSGTGETSPHFFATKIRRKR